MSDEQEIQDIRDRAVTHLAGPDIQYEAHLRQRCSWCGSVLIDVDLSQIMVPVGQEGDTYGSWPVGGFVEAHSPDQRGGMHVLIDPEISEEHGGMIAPQNSCLRMPPEATA